MNTRELAGLIWLSVLIAVALAKGENRPVFGQVVRRFLDRRILLVTGGYAACLVSVVLAARFIGLWDRFLLPETILGFVVSGFPLLLTVTEAAKGRGYFRKIVRSELGIGVIFIFFVNLVTLSLIWELLLQPILFALAATSMLASRDDQPARIRLVVSILLAGLIMILTLNTAIHIFQQRNETEWEEIALSFLLTIWLPLSTILFLVPLAYFVEYDSAFTWMKMGANKNSPSVRDKLALLIGVNLHLYDLNKFRPYWGNQIKNAPSLGVKIREARRFREHLQQQRDERERENYRLLVNTGARGADEHGRQRDKREFKETQNALRWVAICQMGHFRRRGGSYNPDIMTVLSDLTRHGLPKDHGITIKVSADGKAWYGWRRTITGWVFAIGAAAGPPDEWLYDGPEPPTAFPGTGSDWDHFVSGPHARNW
jgi:hypothetical protein